MLASFRPPVLISLSALIAVNLIPLAGALFLGWKVQDILLLFWAENVIIGLFNVARMGVRLLRGDLEALFLIPFFIVHYGLFCAAHGFFLLMMFGAPGEMPPDGPAAMIARIMAGMLEQPGLFWALAGVVISHGVSFLGNFLLAGEFRRTTTKDLMGAPYSRIMILHVTILGGAFVVAGLGQPVYALALLVLIKIAVDVTAHLRERGKFSAPASIDADTHSPGDGR